MSYRFLAFLRGFGRESLGVLRIFAVASLNFSKGVLPIKSTITLSATGVYDDPVHTDARCTRKLL